MAMRQLREEIRAESKRSGPARRVARPPDWYRLPADLWSALLADPETEARYHSKVDKRARGECWYWLGAISSTGHGKLRAGTRTLITDRPDTRVVASHVYGFQLSRGVLRPAEGRMPVIRHKCDESSCHNPSHWLLGTVRDNAVDYTVRARVAGSPLTDSRDPAGRARAIRDAILKARAEGTSTDQAVWLAASAGLPPIQDGLW